MSSTSKEIRGSVSDWDPQNENVARASFGADGKSLVDPTEGVNFIEAGTVLICSGPATLESAASATGETAKDVNVIPIGMIEQASVQQSRPLQRIFEIGSKISYIIPGRTVGGMAINRMLFDGPSLLRMLVMGEVKELAKAGDADPANGEPVRNGQEVFETFTGKNVTVPNPGFNGIDLNFMSSLFELPFGMMMYFRDQQGGDVSAVYFEGCRMSAHSFGIASQATVIAESVNMEFTKVVPVKTMIDDN